MRPTTKLLLDLSYAEFERARVAKREAYMRGTRDELDIARVRYDRALENLRRAQREALAESVL